MRDLTPIEQAAYGPIYAGAHNTDHRMLRLKDGAPCGACEESAREVVKAVRPMITVEALESAAETTARLAEEKAQSADPESQRLARGLRSSAQRLRDRAADIRRQDERNNK